MTVRLDHSRLIPICNAFFIQRGHRRSLLFLIGEESDGGHRIKRALYIGIKRLWIGHGKPEFAKIPHGRCMRLYGSRMGCLRSLNPYEARKLIMHALKLYRPHTGRQNSYGATRGPYGSREWFSFKTAREQAVRGPGAWCDWGNTSHSGHPYGLFPGCLEQKSTHGAPTGSVRRRTNFASPHGPVEFQCKHYKLTGPV